MDDLYVVAGLHSWNKEAFEKIKHLPGSWIYVDNKEDLAQAAKWNPRYIFFLHWSYIVPKEIIDSVECVCFHPSQLPEGRGGSPIQNLILQGHEYTYLTAFKMTEEVDAGPIYLVAFLPLNGSLTEIFKREMELAYDCIKRIIYYQPIPTAQDGMVSSFKRRTPDQSEITEVKSTKQLYDFIRMLDAEDYPHAFIKVGDKALEFTDAELTDHLRITVKVK